MILTAKERLLVNLIKINQGTSFLDFSIPEQMKPFLKAMSADEFDIANKLIALNIISSSPHARCHSQQPHRLCPRCQLKIKV